MRAWTTIEDGIAENGGVIVRFRSTEGVLKVFFLARMN